MATVPTFTTVMNYEGSSFGVQVSEHELQRMSAGDTSLVEEVLKRTTTRLVLMPESGAAVSDNDCLIQDFTVSQETENTSPANLNNNENCKGSSKETWSRNSTRILLSIVSENYAELKNPRTKKKEFWDRIAMEIQGKGLTFSGSELQKKWNNTLDRYRRNKEKESRSGTASIRWEWFETLEKFVDNCEPKVALQNMTFGSSLIQNEDSGSSDGSNSGCDLPRSKKRKMRSESSARAAAKCAKSSSTEKCVKSGNPEKSVRNALVMEMKRMREMKQVMFEELTKMEREKLKEERERWKEERERWKEEKAIRLASDQKKVDAVLLTAKAIQQLATAILKHCA